jgi:hypothetical protein
MDVRKGRDAPMPIDRRRDGHMTVPEIAEVLTTPLSTISAVSRRIGLGQALAVSAHEATLTKRTRPGELVHLDIKYVAGR